MQRLEGAYRHEILQLLEGKNDCVGIELGVAAGGFSRRMVDSGRFAHFFGVDMYADTHDVAQYKQALKTVGLFGPYKLLRMTFDEAFELFEDESLDFIYIDGYAHSGQEGGDTIYKWAQKVRIGGLIAGDDYHEKWPLVQKSVGQFLADTGFEGYVTTEVEPDAGYSEFPSWAAVKTGSTTLSAPSEMIREGKSAAAKVGRKRQFELRLVNASRGLVGEARFERLRQWNKARKG